MLFLNLDLFGNFFARYLLRMFVFQFLFFLFLSFSLIKEMFLLNLITLNSRRFLEILLLFYFLFVFFCFKSFDFSIIFFLFPLILLLFLLVFLKKKEEKDLLFQLYSLLIPLESQMKLGSSFINAWQKSLKELRSQKTRNKAQEITNILKFQQEFHYPDKEIGNFIKDLIVIHQSSNPLKRLKHLQRKVRIEMTFRVKSKRALMQIRSQSGLLSVFYLGLLIWTIKAHGAKYAGLIALSFIFFLIGLLWIFKTGRKMKWSV